MGLLELFITASVPVLNVLILTAVGLFLALDRINILNGDARKHLNNIVYFVFSPALVFTNISRTMTTESMALLWFMPVNILLTFIIGSALGWIVIQITKTPANLKGLILGCCSAGNLGSLLLVIIPSICREKGSPFEDQDICHEHGLAYVSLSIAVSAVLVWTYIYNIVRINAKIDEVDGYTSAEETKKKNHGGHVNGTSLTNNCMMPGHLENGCGLPLLRSEELYETKKPSISIKMKQFLGKIAGTIDLKKLLAPSTIAVIVGFIVGVFPRIRNAMIGESAPLRSINSSVALLGDGAIATLILIMGGNLKKGLCLPIQTSQIVGVIAMRYVALPIIGIGVVKGAVYLGFVHLDPLYRFVLLVQFALPPALNIGIMTQLFGAGESECAVILLWSYAFASLSLTIWSTFFMWLVS
uniref:Putative transporter C5D6.04 n=1 Tax=Anthurium amnicola TaxID=1678845 RepID=A0A1D1ZG23_9ARAE